MLTSTEQFHAHLTYDPDKRLGQGSFKTATPALLDFEGQQPLTGLGGPDVKRSPFGSIEVAIKRPFINNPPTSALGPSAPSRRGTGRGGRSSAGRGGIQGVKRMGMADERHALTNEAKLLVWANALLTFSYDFINHCVAEAMKEGMAIPDYIDAIPSFRFVKAGLATALQLVETKQGAGKPSGNCVTYLIEEMLPVGKGGEFIKYINNANTVPCLPAEHPAYHYCEFLLFLQHVQFETTHRNAFLTDFQGVDTTLTDPQIITNPALGENLFGGGNLHKSFMSFPEQHICNRYCKWPWFGLKPILPHSVTSQNSHQG
ncbi:kinase-like protein [Agrocybe pediades]|nr:kinase-like protein [Agrocybe pediades]